MASQIKTTAPQINGLPLESKSRSKAKRALYWWIIFQAFIKLDPRQQARNPVILFVEIGGLLTFVLFVRTLLGGGTEPQLLTGVATAWLWLTVLLFNLAEAVIEGPARFRAATWHQRCRNLTAKKLDNTAYRQNYSLIPATNLRKEDIILLETGDIVPADAEIVEGTALVDERLLFGEDIPCLRKVGGEQTVVAAGTRVLSDWLVVRTRVNPAASLLPRLANLVDEAKHREFPHLPFRNILLAGSIMIVLFFVNIIWLFSLDHATGSRISIDITILVLLLTALMPVTSSGLWHLVKLAEVTHFIREKVIPSSNWAVETAEKVDMLLLDKYAVVDPGYCQEMTPNSPGKAEPANLPCRSRLGPAIDEVPADRHTATLLKKPIGPDEEIRVDRNLKKRLAHLRSVGVKTVLITNDTPQASAALAAEAGMDDFLCQTTPATSLELIRNYQARGYRVAVAGSSADDAENMRQADLAVAMNTGPQPAREATDMVDLNSKPAKLVRIVEISRQWLATRRAVTLFTLAGDTAKFFVLIPAVFVSVFPGLATMSIMRLTTAASVILAAIIFNALSIVVLTLLIQRGAPRSNLNAGSILINFPPVVYAVGGLITPFIGIKLIDLILMHLGFV